ncbi:MAG: FHA domain-containing protein, partial [Deltaproteobacteria bacterium]|nr:FHA domain-containing protein [Deltaproteobacteria bacterium]
MGNNPAVTTIFDGGRAKVRQLRKSKLVVMTGPEAGRELEMTKPRVGAGRSIINDLTLNDKAVSGTHFEIVSDDDGYKLVDLGSTNGTFVGELRIKEVFLKPGTKFRAGHSEIVFQSLEEVV